jgi:hypothetical protein
MMISSSCEPDSNWQPQDLQSGALPLRHHSTKAIFFNFHIFYNFLESCMKIGLQHGWGRENMGKPLLRPTVRAIFESKQLSPWRTPSFNVRLHILHEYATRTHGTQSESPAQQVDVHQILPGSLGTHLGRFVSLAAEVPPP